MNIFLDEHQLILKLLLKNNIDFMLIGGYAVIYYGYDRTTGDMDLWVKPDNDNKLKLLQALEDAGFSASSLKQIENLDFTKHLVFSIEVEPNKIDFITHVNLVKYNEADKNKIIADVDNMKLPIIHLHDLVKTKINTGRSKDAADVDELQRIRNLKR